MHIAFIKKVALIWEGCFSRSVRAHHLYPFSYATVYALAPLENQLGAYAPTIFARKCRIRLVNILNLAKKIVWQNRSVV